MIEEVGEFAPSFPNSWIRHCK